EHRHGLLGGALGKERREGAVPEVGQHVRLAEPLAHPRSGGPEHFRLDRVRPGHRERQRPAVAPGPRRLLGEPGDQPAPVEQSGPAGGAPPPRRANNPVSAAATPPVGPSASGAAARRLLTARARSARWRSSEAWNGFAGESPSPGFRAPPPR